MRTMSLILAAATALVSSGPTFAQDPDRYRLERTQSGFVRMDTRTGEMSFCEERSGQLACRPAADERAAQADQPTELHRRLEAIERRLTALESRPQPEAGLPSEEEFEQTMSLMERFLRRFWGVAKDLEKESGTGRSGAEPDRT